MNEDYVSFETAKLLKEKGFDWDCKQVYDLVRPQSCADGKMYDNFPDENPNAYDELVSAPTLQMAMKWLREEKKLYIIIEICFDDDRNREPGYYFEIWQLTPPYESPDTPILVFDIYEQACEAAIRYTLENLI